MGGSNVVEVVFGANVTGLTAGVEEVTAQLEGLGDITSGLTSTFLGMGEAIGTAFAIEGISSFVEHMADLGSKVETASSQLGLSQDKILAIQYAAAIADTSLDQATRTIDRFYMSIEQAQTGTGRQAAAFQALGMNVAELTSQGVSMNGMFDMAITKLGSFADSANKSTIIMDLFGNRSATTVRLVNTLSEGMTALTDKTQALGAPTEDVTQKLQMMHVRITDLETVMTNWKMDMADIGMAAVDAADGFVEFLSIVKAIFDGFGTILVGALNNLRDFGVGAKNILEQIATPGAGYFARIGDAAKTAMQNMSTDTHAAGQAVSDLIAQETKLIQTLENPTLTDAGTRKTGKDAPGVIDQGKVEDDMKVWQGALTQMLLEKQAFGQQAEQLELQYWQNILATQEVSAKDEIEIDQKVYNLEKQLHDQAARDTQTAMNKETQEYDKFFQAFNKGIDGMMTGTTTWRKIAQETFMNVFNYGLKALEQYVSKYIVSQQTMTAAAQASSAQQIAAQQTTSAAGDASIIASGIKAIGRDAAQTFGGIFAFLSPTEGPAAAGPAAAGSAAVLAQAASFDVGSWGVPTDTFAMLHAGEKVLTSSENNYGTGGPGDSQGITLQINGGINDAASIRAMIMREGPTIAKAINKQAQLQNSNLRGT